MGCKSEKMESPRRTALALSDEFSGAFARWAKPAKLSSFLFSLSSPSRTPLVAHFLSPLD